MQLKFTLTYNNYIHQLVIVHLVDLVLILPQVGADQGRGDAEVERQQEREDCHHRIHLQHDTAVILAKTSLLYTCSN